MYFKKYTNVPKFIGRIGWIAIRAFYSFKKLFYSYKTSEGPGTLSKDTISDFNKHRFTGPRPRFCYAADNNMYFGGNGKVVPCCYNRDHYFGRYPINTIKEIWTGQSIRKLRHMLQHHDLSSGCHICRLQLENNNYDALPPYYYDLIPVNKRYPSSMEFELSNACNLECIMCSPEFSSKHDKENLFVSQYDDSFVGQLTEFIPHLKQARFYGGEPFLISTYFKIWEKIIELNPDCLITTQTNATILNDKIKDLLGKGRFNIGISFESLQKTRYEEIRKGADFDDFMNNVEYFTSYCHKKSTVLNFSICPMTINWEEIPSLIKFSNDRKALIYLHTVFSPGYLSLKNMPAAEIEKVIISLSEAKLPSETIFEEKNKTHYLDFIMQLKAWHTEALQIKKQTESINERVIREKDELEKTDIKELMEKLARRIEETIAGCIEKTDCLSFNDSTLIMEKIQFLANSVANPIEAKLAIARLIYSRNLIKNLKEIKEQSIQELQIKLNNFINHIKSKG